MQTAARLESLKVLDNERIGAIYVRSLLDVLAAVQQHRGMSSAMLNGDASLQSGVDAKAAEVAAGIQKLKAQNTANPQVLDQQAQIDRLTGEWDTVRKAMSGSSGADNFRRHSELIRNLLGDFQLAADASGLTFDAAPDT